MNPNTTLAFFRDVETMSIPDAPRVGRSIHQAVEFVRPRVDGAPWAFGRAISEHEAPFYIVHVGVMRKRGVVEGILRGLSPDAPVDDEALQGVSGDASMGALLLDWQGRLLCGQFLPAPFVFGVRRLRENKPLSNIEEEMEKSIEDNIGKLLGSPVAMGDPAKAIAQALGGQAPASQGAGGVTPAGDGVETMVYETPMTLDNLYAIAKSLQGVAGLESDAIRVRVVTRTVRRKRGKGIVPPDCEEGMLPSFYARDLNRVWNKTPKKRGAALHAYLADPVAPEARIDVLANPLALAEDLTPTALSYGRWPANPHHSLNIAQQAAVGRVRATEQGVVAINGPPGTGKTTLLRDLVADMVVKRGRRLADLAHPKDGFVDTFIKPLGEEEEPFNGVLVRDDLMEGTSIIVASSNNAAVENVSLALPTLSSIDTNTFAHARYIQAAATDVAVKMAQGTGASTEVWGLAALRMGNKDNIRNVFAGLNRPFGKDGSEEVVRGGLVDALEDKGACGLPEWQLYQREFAKKHAIVEQLLDMRHAHFMEPRNLVVLERMEALCDPVSETIQEGLGWSLPRVRVWWGDACTPSGGEGVVFAPWRCAHGLGFVQELRARCARIKINAGLLSLCWKVPDAAFFGQDPDAYHRASVWTDVGLEKARSELFLAAMALHEAFLRANLRKLPTFVKTLRKVLVGDVRVSESLLLQVWTSLFAVSPVVSTTLASVRRLPLAPGWIGLLLIDEAGQATPQSVVGALSRAHKAVLVGDPLQIEPVFSVPKPIVERLMQERWVAARFSPLDQSAQTVADGVMARGAWIPRGAVEEGVARRDCGEGVAPAAEEGGPAEPLGWTVPVVAGRAGKALSHHHENRGLSGAFAGGPGLALGQGPRVWTGMPLRVHRRCQEPMFGAANAISYGGQMVQGTPPLVEGDQVRAFGPSAWFDAAGGGEEGKVRAQEMACLRACLLKARQDPPMLNGVPLSMFVVSPFVEVAEACRKVSFEVFGRQARSVCKTGTVHTFQGQEADVVLLVLGTAQGMAGQHSRAWACAQANLLNVAVTRARLRLYTIANAQDWKALPFFDALHDRYQAAGQIVAYPRLT